MGLMNEAAPDHEGFTVAYVRRDGVSEESLLVRELQYPGDSECREDILLLGAGCECGWRSGHFWPMATDRPRWSPYSAFVSERDDEKVATLWKEHVKDVRAARSGARSLQ